MGNFQSKFVKMLTNDGGRNADQGNEILEPDSIDSPWTVDDVMADINSSNVIGLEKLIKSQEKRVSRASQEEKQKRAAVFNRIASMGRIDLVSVLLDHGIDPTDSEMVVFI